MAKTAISWSDEAWNYNRGCARQSPGCGAKAGEGGCYAERQAIRMAGSGQPYEGLVRSTPNGPRWTGKVSTGSNELLTRPLRWQTPRMVFVNSMSDLFLPARPDADIDDVFAVMLICALHGHRVGHVFQVLTKCTERMVAYMHADDLAERLAKRAGNTMEDGDGWHDAVWNHVKVHGAAHSSIWMGVSVESQEFARARVLHLLDVAAGLHWVSAEPLLGPVDLADIEVISEEGMRPRAAVDALRGHVKGPDDMIGRKLGWVVAGCESGPGRRPAEIDWFRSLRDQCAAANVPFFLKQLEVNGKVRKHPMPELDGVVHDAFPQHAEYPEVTP
jgi:protein gp37